MRAWGLGFRVTESLYTQSRIKTSFLRFRVKGL